MILRAKITSILSDNSGVGASTGKEWRKVEYLAETDGQYPKKVKVFATQDGVINGLQVGREYDLHLEIEAREYNGNYYNNVKVWKYSAI
jgi:hypothetical protein